MAHKFKSTYALAPTFAWSPHEKHLEFYIQSHLVKTKPIRKQLYGVLPIDDFVDTMLNEAESETRRLARQRKLTRRHA